MGISKRLKFIADMVTAGYRACDVGTDHGFVPAYLLKNNICPYVIAVDISEGSLLKARELSDRLGLSDRMECRLSDGFENILPGEADCAVISGMGGILMTHIIEAHPEVVSSLKEMVLSPHRDADLVRSYVESCGFTIVSDVTVTDKKKEYVVLKAVR